MRRKKSEAVFGNNDDFATTMTFSINKTLIFISSLKVILKEKDLWRMTKKRGALLLKD